MAKPKQKPLDQKRISRILGAEIVGPVAGGVAGAMAGYMQMKSESFKELKRTIALVRIAGMEIDRLACETHAASADPEKFSALLDKLKGEIDDLTELRKGL